jgi:hypothetical protein
VNFLWFSKASGKNDILLSAVMTHAGFEFVLLLLGVFFGLLSCSCGDGPITCQGVLWVTVLTHVN